MPAADPQLEDAVRAGYAARTPRSHRLAERARGLLPGGDTRTGTFFLPYPLYMERGEGCELVDVDGNRYTDFLNNFTSLIHGHAHPAIVGAIVDQAQRGTTTGFPNEAQLDLAEVLQRRVPSLERLRFCNSGTEAVMNVCRVARAFTNRRLLVKIEGGYNGAYDVAQISVSPGDHAPPYPTGRAEGPGVSPGILAEVLVVPFNDLEVLRWVLGRYARDVAAILVEPVVSMAGMVPPDDGYLAGLVDAAHAVGALVIFDEIVTFRLAMGGAQERFGLTPDLTTLGKIIGGGLPVGAFGGRADVMQLFEPTRSNGIAQSGTYNGNNTTMAAGLAAMALLDHEEFHRLDSLGARLREGLQAAATRRGVVATVQGMGSLAHVHYCTGPIRNYRDALRGSKAAAQLMHLGLLNRGIVSAPRGLWAVSSAMSEADVDSACAAFGGVLDEYGDAFVQQARQAPAVASS